MKVLLDTHTFIWLLEGSENMTIISADNNFELYTRNILW